MQFTDNQEELNLKSANDFLKNVLLIVCGLLISYLFVRNTLPQNSNISKFDELLNVISKNYVDSLELDQIENKAVTNLLNSLDPHSIYISSEDLQAANEPLEGSFSGVGIEFFIAKDTIVVVSPISGGPSELAGIKSGDKIVKINDSLVAGVKITNAEVYKKLRGPRDSKVKVTIQRAFKLLPTLVLKRDNIQVNSVDPLVMVDEKTGYIKVNSFGENTYAEFYNHLSELVEKKGDNLIIDLRQNTGGFLEVAVAILDELIEEKKLLVFTEGRHYPKEEFYTKKKGIFENGNVAILIDEGSASASEILAGAIQDLDRGIVIGRRSFGKGLVQNQISLSDGSAVRLTVAKYFTPSGRNIQKPYKNNSNYEDEIYDRYKSGELFEAEKQLSTDTIIYKTLSGRTVKGGGGIYPDVFVPIDTNYDFVNFSILRGQIPDFIFSNYDQLSKNINFYKNVDDFVNNYQLSSTTLESFYRFAKLNGAKWNGAKKSTYENKLKQNIKSYIAKQFYKDQGQIKVNNQSDPMVIKTVSIFKNRKIK